VIRLIGVDLPNKKRIAYSLTAIHGIGIQSAKKNLLNQRISMIQQEQKI